MGYTHGTKWTDELIREKVQEVIDALELDRMPSQKECKNYFKNESLSNAVAKRMGWYALAEEMGLPVKNSDTYFGKKQEASVEEMLKTKGFEVRRMSQNFPYDLLVDDCVKIDVKAAHLYEGPNGSFYTFNLEKPYATCDIYILCTLSKENEIQKIYIVPSKFVVSNTQISVGVEKSKYDRFIDDWDYISKLSEYWSNVN